MTVKELIEQLSKLEQDKEIKLLDENEGFAYSLDDNIVIRHVSECVKTYVKNGVETTESAIDEIGDNDDCYVVSPFDLKHTVNIEKIMYL